MTTRTRMITTIAAAAISATALAANADQHANAPSEAIAARAIQSYYNDLPIDKRGGTSFLVRLENRYENSAVRCKASVPYSEKNKEAIRHSKAYESVDTNCISYNRRGLAYAVKMGLVDKTQPSPYVTQYALTDQGRKHLQKTGRWYRVFVARDALEHVLDIKSDENPYHVPIADVRFSLAPAVQDWAKPYVGNDKDDLIRLNNRSVQKRTARLWRTDRGWQLFYVTR